MDRASNGSITKEQIDRYVKARNKLYGHLGDTMRETSKMYEETFGHPYTSNGLLKATDWALNKIEKVFESPAFSCPECGEPLEECIGVYGEDTCDSVVCPQGCDLRYHYGM